MLRVGVVGIGFMGMVHYLSYQKLRDVQVTALCEKQQKRLDGDWRDIKGNFGPAGEQMDLSGIETFTEVEDLLASDVDLVDITLPPALHADVAVRSLAAGKHVFCEKPMALKVEDCQRMTKAAEQAGKLLMVGHVLPFFPEYQWALQVVQSGQFGKLLGGSFKRVISDPSWLANFWQPDQVGGPLLDLHIHDAHFIRLLFGMPNSVSSCGSQKNGLPEYWHTHFDYGESGPVVHATSGTLRQQGRSFDHGFEIQLEGATLAFEFSVTGDQADYHCPPTLLAAESKVEYPQLPDGDPMHAFAAELGEVVASVQRGTSIEILDSALAQDALLLCHKQAESIQSRRRVEV